MRDEEKPLHTRKWSTMCSTGQRGTQTQKHNLTIMTKRGKWGQGIIKKRL